MSNVEKFKHITDTMYTTYCNKNSDYGNSFGDTFQELGIISAVTRMNDKMNRLKSLVTKSDRKVNDETIEDTLLDLANYAVMTLIELQNNKEKETNFFQETLKETLEETLEAKDKNTCNKIDHFKEARKINLNDIPEVIMEQLSEYALGALRAYTMTELIPSIGSDILLRDLSKNITQYIVYLDLNEDDMEGEDIIKMYSEVVRLRDIMTVEFENVFERSPMQFA